MLNMFDVITKKGARAALLAAVAVVSTGSAVAATTISSSATDVSISLSLLTIPASLTLGTASGTAGAAYNVDNTLLSINQGLGLGNTGLINQGISTGVAKATAVSNGTTGSATASINGLGLNLTALGITSLGLNSGLITSNTIFDGTTLSGTSSIANLTLSTLLGSLPLDAGLLASTAANRTLVDILGLKVTLNEQIGSDMTANGIDTRSLTTNALHLSYKDFAIGGGLLSGDIIIGQSQVSVAQAAVPEPATWAMMIVGFGMVGGVLRRQQRQTRALA